MQGIGDAAAGAVVQPKMAFAQAKTVKISLLAPRTGEVAAWGLPGLYGCEIWAEQVNAAGGVDIGGEPHMVELVSYDNEYAPDKARTGATKLIAEAAGIEVVDQVFSTFRPRILHPS